MVEQVSAAHASSHNHVKIATKLWKSQPGEPSED